MSAKDKEYVKWFVLTFLAVVFITIIAVQVGTDSSEATSRIEEIDSDSSKAISRIDTMDSGLIEVTPRIEAIIISDNGESHIIVDGKLAHEGDIINGFRILKIYPDKVEFEKNGNLWVSSISKTITPAAKHKKPIAKFNPIVYITRTGQCYHSGSCGYLSRSKIPIPLSEARKWYRPCSRCLTNTPVTTRADNRDVANEFGFVSLQQQRDLSTPSTRLEGHWRNEEGTSDLYYSITEPSLKIGYFIIHNKRGRPGAPIRLKILSEEPSGDRIIVREFNDFRRLQLVLGYRITKSEVTYCIPKHGQSMTQEKTVMGDPMLEVYRYVDDKTSP